MIPFTSQRRLHSLLSFQTLDKGFLCKLIRAKMSPRPNSSAILRFFHRLPISLDVSAGTIAQVKQSQPVGIGIFSLFDQIIIPFCLSPRGRLISNHSSVISTLTELPLSLRLHSFPTGLPASVLIHQHWLRSIGQCDHLKTSVFILIKSTVLVAQLYMLLCSP